MFYGSYAYFTKLEDRTVFSKKIKTLMMSKEEQTRLQALKEEEEFENF